MRGVFLTPRFDLFHSRDEPVEEKGVHLQRKLVGHDDLLVLLPRIPDRRVHLCTEPQRDGIEEFAHECAGDCVCMLKQATKDVEYVRFRTGNGFRVACGSADGICETGWSDTELALWTRKRGLPLTSSRIGIYP